MKFKPTKTLLYHSPMRFVRKFWMLIVHVALYSNF